jgi:hypothetical protein
LKASVELDGPFDCRWKEVSKGASPEMHARGSAELASSWSKIFIEYSTLLQLPPVVPPPIHQPSSDSK